MREILFRGKRIDNGKWVVGNLFIPDKPETPTQICIGTNVIRISYDINPETVGQYTGLTDKNGKKIFEGDIISIPFEEDVVYYENAEVYFDTEHCGWYVRYFDDESFSLWVYDDCDITIIGNIHDNPELLKGDKNNG